MTDRLVTLAEAATLLGVSKATLRNWDKSGRLSAARHPVNGYRQFHLSELTRLQQQIGLPFEVEPQAAADDSELDIRSVKRIVSRLHDVLRDADSHSNIIERFDEITKLIFAKVIADRGARTNSPFHSEHVSPEAVRRFYKELAKQNSTFIPDRFSSLKCSDAAVLQALDLLRTFDFGSAEFDFKGLAYEEVIKNTFDKGDHQQFFTPPHIVDFIVSMCARFLKGKVCDPAAGTGGFLACVARQKANYECLTAIEIDERLAWVAGMNMFLHDAQNIETIWLQNSGTLGSGAIPLFNTFDAIITNPPFGSDFTDHESLQTMELGRDRVARRRGILFIERCHRLLKEGGLLAIIIDEGVLNLSHAVDVRQFITANFDIRAIISLPETAFMPYASVNASILVMQKAASTDCNRKVFLAKAETVGRKPNGDEDIRYDREGKSYLESDLPEILSAWNGFLRAEKTGDSEKIYITDVAENLNANDNGHRLDFQYHHPSRVESARVLGMCPYPLIKLGDICAERNISFIPSQELPDIIIRYTGLANIEAGTGVAEQIPTPTNSLKSGVKRYEPGDIIFAKMRPGLRKVAFMDFDEGGYVSPECSVYVVRPGSDGAPRVDPLLLSVLLRSDFVFGQITHLIAGIGRPRISSTELRQVAIPLLPAELQFSIKNTYLKRIEEARLLRSDAERLVSEAGQLLKRSVSEVATAFSQRIP